MTAHPRAHLFALATAVLASAAAGLAFDMTPLAGVVAVTLAALSGLAIVSLRPQAVPSRSGQGPMTRARVRRPAGVASRASGR